MQCALLAGEKSTPCSHHFPPRPPKQKNASSLVTPVGAAAQRQQRLLHVVARDDAARVFDPVEDCHVGSVLWRVVVGLALVLLEWVDEVERDGWLRRGRHVGELALGWDALALVAVLAAQRGRGKVGGKGKVVSRKG
eukprot:352756-Chlamydomonas_euryale.AAC.3